MKLIKQRHKKDCGVACIAMIIDAPYDKAMSAVQYLIEPYYDPDKYGLTTLQIRKILQSFGFETYHRLRKYNPKIKGKMILKVDPYGRKWHWVVRTATGKILDPAGFKKDYNIISYIEIL